jgi:hypothetical protein
MLNETSIGNVSFRNIPAEKRVGLRIGGLGLTLQQNTWNDLVRLTGDIGVIRPDAEALDDNDSDDEIDIAEDEKMQTDEEETREENNEHQVF